VGVGVLMVVVLVARMGELFWYEQYPGEFQVTVSKIMMIWIYTTDHFE